MLCALAVTLAGCTSEAPAADEPSTAGAAPAVEVATVTDSQQPAQDGLVRWTTAWRACFTAAAPDGTAVAGWESQVVTPEGVSPEVDDLPGGCLDLELATGVNAPEAGTPGRDAALAAAQDLAYRVRSVHEDGTVSPWTNPVPAGSVRPAA